MNGVPLLVAIGVLSILGIGALRHDWGIVAASAAFIFVIVAVEICDAIKELRK